MEVLYDIFHIEPPKKEAPVTENTSHSPKSKNSQTQILRRSKRKRTEFFGQSQKRKKMVKRNSREEFSLGGR